MSLVAAYGSSGEDSDQDSCDEGPTPSPSKAADVDLSNHSKNNSGLSLPAPKVAVREKEQEDASNKNMFAALPLPKKKVPIASIAEKEDDIPVTKPKSRGPQPKEKVKIIIPSLSEFQDLDEESEPKPKKSKPTPVPKGSGLLAILPEPKHSAGKPRLVPHVLTKKAPQPKKPVIPKKPPVKPMAKPNLVASYVDSDEDSGDEGISTSVKPMTSGIDFFSLTAQPAPEPAEINLDDLLPPTVGPSPRRPVVCEPTMISQETEPGSSWHEESPSESQQDEVQLDEEALRQLCGRRVQRGAEEVNIIDLHGDNMMPDPKEWMLKQMTEEQETPAHRNAAPASAHRRKHQITYLAFQAKEREIELKNQWAQNRMTKKQTQAKYGF